MGTLSWFLNDSLSTRLTVSLIHFLWQGCVAASVVILGEHLLRNRSSRLRYSWNVTVMLGMAACLPITFWLVNFEPTDAQPSSLVILDSLSSVEREEAVPNNPANRATTNLLENAKHASSATVASNLETYTKSVPASWPWSVDTDWARLFPPLSRSIAIFYVFGVTAVLSRLGHSLLGGHRLRQSSKLVVETALLDSVRKLARQVGLRTVPPVAWCHQISIPVVVGVIKPIVLLPVEVVTGLTSRQLEALLLHELSHIRRFDPIVNLLQRCIEAMLFFHPAVWFVSRRVSFERELVADDLVLATGWSRPMYADALLRVAELSASVVARRPAVSETVLGATGKSSSEFRVRVLRLLNSHPPKLDISLNVMLIALLFLGMSSMFVYSWAMLRETPSESSEAPVAAIEQAEADKTGVRIRGRVLDIHTGELIEKCRMVPAMSEREDASHITWQSQYLKEFNDGSFVYETDRAWAKTRLRIEADGYLPALTPYVDKGEDIEVDVKLERAVLTGIVRLPDGRPAAGAQVAIASWTNEVRVDDGEISYQGHASKLRKVIETDELGRFDMPAEIDSSVLIIAHPQGYAEKANAETSLVQRTPAASSVENAAKPQEPTVIVLEPWGRVEGRVLMGDQPVVGAKYWVYQSRSDDVHVWNQTKVETVNDGRFEVDHVPPGRFGTCQRYVEGSDGTSSFSLSGLVSHFDVPAGKTVSLMFGGRGRTLVGKLMAQEELHAQIDWSKAKLQVRLQPPPFMQRVEGVDASAQAWSKFQASEEGKWYKPQSHSIQADGTLRIEGLPAASYELDVTLEGDQVDGTTVWKGSRPMIVPADKPTDENTPVHLGDIPIMLSAGSKAPNFSVMTKPSSPQDAKLDPNLPWRAYGRVVDKDGKPLAGVTVRAATGVGTLLGGGSGVTDQEGRYDFQFGKGISIAKDKEGKPNPQTQYAIISASLEGHFEENFNRHGDGIASLEDVDEATLKHWSVGADQVCTPDKPRKLDFVMLPAAKVAGTLIDEKDRPLAEYSVALTSKVLSPGAEVLAQVVTDRDGRFSIISIPTTSPYQFEVRKPRSQLQPPWDDSWASGLISFLEPREGDLAVNANASAADTSVVTVKTFRIKIVGPGIGGKQALKLAEHQDMLSELKRDSLTEKSPTLESWTMTLSNADQAKKQE